MAARPALDRLDALARNVRELRNTAERMLILSREGRLERDDLPSGVRSVEAGSPGGLTLPEGGVSLPELERRFVVQAMMRSRGNIGRAAALLGISYKTLQYRLRKHGLERETFLDEGR